MNDLHKLESYDIDIIKSIIDNQLEESIHIEFKSAQALAKKDHEKKEISKDVSAFANSDGGIIIYGVNEENHVANSISYIDGNVFTKEWLEQIIQSTIQRTIPDLKIFPIRESGDIKKSIYVVQIPSSLEAPHLCKDKRFYRRFNFESAMMEEYEIRALYDRKQKSKLEINALFIYKTKNEFELSVEFDCEVLIKNIGNKMEDKYNISIVISRFNSKKLQFNWRSEGATRNYDYTLLDDNCIKIHSSSITPIFPNETLKVLRFKFEVQKEELLLFKENAIIDCHLVYQDGTDQMTESFKEINF